MIKYFLIAVCGFAFSQVCAANSVQTCKAVNGAKSAPNEISKKMTRCVVELTGGRVGDVVEIKNEFNYIVASGKIVKKDGRYAVVIIGRTVKPIKTGYPVFIRNTDNPDFWTATTAPF